MIRHFASSTAADINISIYAYNSHASYLLQTRPVASNALQLFTALDHYTHALKKENVVI